MRKNKLIELLNNIPGNHDIVIWNGFVGDIHNIDSEIVERELVKYSKEYLGLRCSDVDEINSLCKEQEWDFPNIFMKDEDLKFWYGNRKKKIYLLQMKKRGKEFFDRACGKVEY